MSDPQKPADVSVEYLKIGEENVLALLVHLEVFENIFMSCVAGSLTIMDSEGANFVEDNEIEFNEPISFAVTGVGEQNRLVFEGHINGLRNETARGATKLYTMDFTSKELRKNEETFINRKFENEKPQDILSYILKDKLEGEEVDVSNVEGEPMEFLGSNRKPLWVIKHVVTNGVAKPEAGDGQNDRKEEKELKSSTGFLCWQTLSESGLNAFRASSLTKLLEGAFEDHDGYTNTILNRSASAEEMMKTAIDVKFQTMGDVQSRMKSGAFRSKNVSYDMDTGLYKVFEHFAEDHMTDKQKKIVTSFTRTLFKPYSNEKFGKSCELHSANTGDQSRNNLLQNNATQNVFNDSAGTVTLYPQYGVHAGDTFNIEMQKRDTGTSNKMPHNKHSGKYVVKQIAHVIEQQNKGYSKVTLLRSTNSEETQK